MSELKEEKGSNNSSWRQQVREDEIEVGEDEKREEDRERGREEERRESFKREKEKGRSGPWYRYPYSMDTSWCW